MRSNGSFDTDAHPQPMESVMESHQALLERLASGRRIVNLCLFSWLAAGAFHVTETPLAVLFFLGSTVAAIAGMARITDGLGLSGSRSTVLVVASAIPLIGQLVMAWFSTRAAKVLRSAGYRVGMFLSSKGCEA